jgi:hypothetical protein
VLYGGAYLTRDNGAGFHRKGGDGEATFESGKTSMVTLIGRAGAYKRLHAASLREETKNQYIACLASPSILLAGVLRTIPIKKIEKRGPFALDDSRYIIVGLRPWRCIHHDEVRRTRWSQFGYKLYLGSLFTADLRSLQRSTAVQRACKGLS